MKKVAIGVLLVLVGIQFIRIDMENPPVIAKDNFVDIVEASDDVKLLLKNTCYDCHSNEVVYPWYSNIAPVSWWVGHHVDEGREHVNFSEWSKYNDDQKEHILEECYEELEKHKMPLSSYVSMHEEAELTEKDRGVLIEFFKSI